jgi:coenzyme F420-reducing hydrogenase delta subunit/DNA-binding transcriptional ArsR family regulator
MCSGRVDLAFVLRAFSNGTDGVFIGGCHLNECHYITDGNHHAFAMVQICRKMLAHIGLNPERLRIAEMSAGEGIRFAEIMNDFSRKLRELGPLGAGEGVDKDALKFRLEAMTRLVPYIRLVERERLRVRCRSAEEYEAYFQSDEVNRLFREMIFDNLAISEIMTLLREGPKSTGEIAGALGLPTPEVARHLNSSARQGLAKFDQEQKRFVTM